MKRLLFVALVLMGSVCSAQNVRYDEVVPSISSLFPYYLTANVPPNTPVLSVCNSPAVLNGSGACINYATTYTSVGVACPNGAQDTPQPQPSACQSTGDAQGNIGFWAPPGKYAYTVCIQNNCFPPRTITLALTSTVLSCQTGIGDGLNAIPAGTYLQSFCFNDSGLPVTITGIRCFTDNSGASTMNATDNSTNALLTAPITCSNAFAAGTQSAHVVIPNGGWIKFTFVSDGASKQTTWTVTE